MPSFPSHAIYSPPPVHPHCLSAPLYEILVSLLSVPCGPHVQLHSVSSGACLVTTFHGKRPGDSGRLYFFCALFVRKIGSSGFSALQEDRRLEGLIHSVAGKSPPWLAKFLKALAPLVTLTFTVINVLGPFFIKFYALLYKVYVRIEQKSRPVAPFYFVTGVFITSFQRGCGYQGWGADHKLFEYESEVVMFGQEDLRILARGFGRCFGCFADASFLR